MRRVQKYVVRRLKLIRRNRMNFNRKAEISRKTKETDIQIVLNLDGSGKADIHTGVGFFDHMLNGFARHGLFDLTVHVNGDLEVDDHHTIEDTGIVLGTAIRAAIGDKQGLRRYGSSILPMDETLVMTALDLGGRPWFSFEGDFTSDRCGDMGTQMVREFFYAISYTAGMNLHMKILDGRNDHHKIEALFKSFARALDEATQTDPRIVGLLSTKGAL